ncbi:hypothetical protein NEF87_000794 [Candidatus Lokiarchaeum ossiferum]|uniref:Uncharacterized protein n=1 Tax=Candidatus Lokiarchaeum ossiferum TaxID=2951803 RepID=A0ABY6HPL9_9ARCH|nr:hypothetical protein NEF87_000794 [Candidatus Lokiarchaeum sp. B-35]
MQMGSVPFSIIIAKFDDIKGPICLFAQKKNFCNFLGKPCDEITNNWIMDSFQIKKDIFIFDDTEYFIQGISIHSENKEVRGFKDRYAILIRSEKKLGILKKKIINLIKNDFLKLIDTKKIDKLNLFVGFANKWTEKLQNMGSITDILEKDEELRKAKHELKETKQIFKQASEKFIIQYFGGLLSKMLDKEVKSSQGLIYLCLKEAFNNNNKIKLDFASLKEIFFNNLDEKLISLNFTNHDLIINSLIDELRQHQSLLMMMNI